ncbi:hypothetical protein C8R48DRAFT_677658 [Suillus tomentosus]|nr:hypothetical protein C8R48DRAFT_677658 [Suillus tomentosus]
MTTILLSHAAPSKFTDKYSVASQNDQALIKITGLDVKRFMFMFTSVFANRSLFICQESVVVLDSHAIYCNGKGPGRIDIRRDVPVEKNGINSIEWRWTMEPATVRLCQRILLVTSAEIQRSAGSGCLGMELICGAAEPMRSKSEIQTLMVTSVEKDLNVLAAT